MKDNILFFSGGAYVFGKEKAMLRIMAGLQAQDWQIHCVINGFNDGKWIELLEEARIHYTPVKLGKFTKSPKLLHIKWTLHALIHLPFALYKIKHLIKRKSPKWLFFDSHITAAIVLILLSPKGIPIIRHGELPGKSDFFFKILKKHLNQHQIYHIGNTQFVCSELERLGLPAEQIHCIHNGFFIPNQIKTDSTNASLQNLAIIIGCIGQIGPWKGQEDLIEALAIIKNQGILFLCKLAGKGDQTYLDHLNKRIQELGLTNQVEIIGYIDQPQSFYTSIDVNVVPSRFEEPFGNVAAEAGMYAVPCIVTNKGGLPEVIKDGITGFIVPANSPKDIAAKVTWLAANPLERTKMGEEAYAWISENFTISKMVQKYEAFFYKTRG